jgi:SOS-response transcriptional repressor LexA
MDKKTKPVTSKQAEMLNVIMLLAGNLDRFPSIREIGEAMGGRSTNGIRTTLIALEKKGQIEKIPGVSRGWKFPEKKDREAIELLRRLKKWGGIAPSPVWDEIEIFLKSRDQG